MSAGCAAALPDADAETAPFGHRKPKSQRKPAGAAQVGGGGAGQRPRTALAMRK